MIARVVVGEDVSATGAAEEVQTKLCDMLRGTPVRPNGDVVLAQTVIHINGKYIVVVTIIF